MKNGGSKKQKFKILCFTKISRTFQII